MRLRSIPVLPDDTGDWTASIVLMPWTPGTELTFTFDEPATVVDAGYAKVVAKAAHASTVRIDLAPDTVPGSDGTLLLQGKGGCWGTHGSSTCGTTMTCKDPATPSPPPNRVVSISEQMVMAPRVSAASCSTLRIEWDRPEGHDPVNLEYEVNVIDVETRRSTPHRTAEIEYTVQHLEADHEYIMQVRAHDATQDTDSVNQPVTGVSSKYSTLPDDAKPENLVIQPETSMESCTQLELTLPKVPVCRHDNDFVSVEWRPARAGERWESLMDRIDEGDLVNDRLVVDHLSAYAAYEFRTLLHHFGPSGSGGTVVTGPSTGALLVAMLEDELLRAPVAIATGSASFEIHLPQASPCRGALQTSIWYASDGGHGWRKLQGGGIEREGRVVRANSLRCPGTCRFRAVYDNILHWAEPSMASNAVVAPRLPALRLTHQRVQVKLSQRPEELRQGGDAEQWKGLFRDDLATALSLSPSSIDVVEVRGNGAFVVFDLPRRSGAPLEQGSNANEKAPLASLATLLAQPACKTNLALRQPGKCSSSCGNSSSPAAVNDGDLRQYAPHTWVPCPTDKRPWWSVELPAATSNPYVRIMIGDNGTNDAQSEVELSIGYNAGIGPQMLKCQDLKVDRGSATGTVCEGTGKWLTISSRSGAALSLAEVHVCDLSEVNALLKQPTIGSLDSGAGLLEILDDGARVAQLTPSLLPFGVSGRDAAWRLPAKTFDPFSPATEAAAIAAVVVACVLAVIYHISARCSRGPAFSRVSEFDLQGKQVMWDDAGSFDDEDAVHNEARGRDVEDDLATVEHGRTYGRSHSTMPVTYERSFDGKTVASNVYISGGAGIEQLLEQVRAGAATTFSTPVEHVSLQYVDEQTGQYDQAWYDPVLGEGSDLEDLLKSPRWRVLVLGEPTIAAIAAAADGCANEVTSSNNHECDGGTTSSVSEALMAPASRPEAGPKECVATDPLLQPAFQVPVLAPVLMPVPLASASASAPAHVPVPVLPCPEPPGAPGATNSGITLTVSGELVERKKSTLTVDGELVTEQV